jgi:hypothetical protein
MAISDPPPPTAALSNPAKFADLVILTDASRRKFDVVMSWAIDRLGGSLIASGGTAGSQLTDKSKRRPGLQGRRYQRCQGQRQTARPRSHCSRPFVRPCLLARRARPGRVSDSNCLVTRPRQNQAHRCMRAAGLVCCSAAAIGGRTRQTGFPLRAPPTAYQSRRHLRRCGSAAVAVRGRQASSSPCSMPVGRYD